MPAAVINIHLGAVNPGLLRQVRQHLPLPHLKHHLPILQQPYVRPQRHPHLEGQPRIRAHPIPHPKSPVIIVAREPKPPGRMRQVIRAKTMPRSQRFIHHPPVRVDLPAERFGRDDVGRDRPKMRLVWVNLHPERASRVGMRVRVHPSHSHHRMPARQQQLIPQLQRPFQRAEHHKPRKKSVQGSLRQRLRAGLKLTHQIPQFNPREPPHIPIRPVERLFVEKRQGVIHRMRQERYCASRARLVDQLLPVRGKARELKIVPKDQHVIAALSGGAVVHFFAREQQQPAFAFLRVALDVAHQHVVIRHDQHVHASPQTRGSQLGVRAGSVRIDGVHVQRNDQFFHNSKIIPPA